MKDYLQSFYSSNPMWSQSEFRTQPPGLGRQQGHPEADVTQPECYTDAYGCTWPCPPQSTQQERTREDPHINQSIDRSQRHPHVTAASHPHLVHPPEAEPRREFVQCRRCGQYPIVPQGRWCHTCTEQYETGEYSLACPQLEGSKVHGQQPDNPDEQLERCSHASCDALHLMAHEQPSGLGVHQERINSCTVCCSASDVIPAINHCGVCWQRHLDRLSSRIARKAKIEFYDRADPFYELTNFFPCSIVIAGKEYPTTEHYYQAAKFITTFPDIAEVIRCTERPREAFNIAQTYRAYQRADWHEVSLDIMETALLAKFSIEPMRRLLMLTEDRRLVEHTVNDSFWGDGGNGRGQNNLGRLLEKVRAQLCDDRFDASSHACVTDVDPPLALCEREQPQAQFGGEEDAPVAIVAHRNEDNDPPSTDDSRPQATDHLETDRSAPKHEAHSHQESPSIALTTVASGTERENQTSEQLLVPVHQDEGDVEVQPLPPSAEFETNRSNVADTNRPTPTDHNNGESRREDVCTDDPSSENSGAKSTTSTVPAMPIVRSLPKTPTKEAPRQSTAAARRRETELAQTEVVKSRPSYQVAPTTRDNNRVTRQSTSLTASSRALASGKERSDSARKVSRDSSGKVRKPVVASKPRWR